MREHEINYLNTFIMGWYMTDLTICDELINLHKNNPNKFFGGFGSYDGIIKIDNTQKESIDSALLPKSLNDVRYGSILNNCANLYSEKYSRIERETYSVTEPFHIQEYPPGGGFKVWHCERNTNPKSWSRILVWMTYLNDVRDEGGTEFYYHGIKIRADKGLTLMWPVDWMFTHKGVISPSETKYIITGWFNLNNGNENENRNLLGRPS